MAQMDLGRRRSAIRWEVGDMYGGSINAVATKSSVGDSIFAFTAVS